MKCSALSVIIGTGGVLLWFSALAPAARGQVLVPGTGQRVAGVGDDFEDPHWEYIQNLPKSTADLDGQQHQPTGESKNGRWYEGIKRGHPDVVRRVPTPAGGLPGSRGSMLLRSLYTGIPGRPSYRMQQDDLIADVNYKLGGAIPVSRGPSVVTRVYFALSSNGKNSPVPPSLLHATEAYTMKRSGGRFSRASRQLETYWLGMFVDFQSKADGRHDKDSAVIRIRANESGEDFPALTINETGWWTLGMSFSPDGQVHYFADPASTI